MERLVELPLLSNSVTGRAKLVKWQVGRVPRREGLGQYKIAGRSGPPRLFVTPEAAGRHRPDSPWAPWITTRAGADPAMPGPDSR